MDLSIVIPTFNEPTNVKVITSRIHSVMQGAKLNYEIWFIDDSRDETPERLAELSTEFPSVKYVHRESERGLGTAVVEGFRRSTGPHIVVMDADLQHPPELLPAIYARLKSGVDVVIPSRFVSGGTDGGLNAIRKLVSWTARVIGQVSIKRLRNISDCTGGYFGVHRSVIDGATLDPIGWKILMEVLVKGKYATVHEIPYSFVARHAGESKMSLREQWNYIRHIVKLILGRPEDRRFYMFCLVGALGVIVNLAVLSVMLHICHAHPLVASIVASLVAMVHNFLWNDRVTWKGHANPVLWRRVLQFPQFVFVSSVGIAATTFLAQCFLWLHWPEELGQLVGIVIATAWSFVANNRWTWSGSAHKVALTQISVTREALHRNV